MLHFLLAAECYINFCCIKSNLFLVTDAGYERDGAHNHSTVFSVIKKAPCGKKDADKHSIKETSDRFSSLVGMSFFVFVSNTLSEIRGRVLVIFALHSPFMALEFQNRTTLWGTDAGTFSSNKLYSWMKSWKHIWRLYSWKTAKIPPKCNICVEWANETMRRAPNTLR